MLGETLGDRLHELLWVARKAADVAQVEEEKKVEWLLLRKMDLGWRTNVRGRE